MEKVLVIKLTYYNLNEGKYTNAGIHAGLSLALISNKWLEDTFFGSFIVPR